nr:hypothetical protein [Tanacetum cinerariifolium]
MSDSDELGVTYTDISSPFEELSDIGSSRADDHEHLELPEMLEDPYVEVALQAPPSPDYIPGPEEPEQAPPSPDYVPGPKHDDDKIVAEDQPYVEDVSPTAQPPEYVPESDLEEHPEDNDDEDPEDDPTEPFETDESAATLPPHPAYRVTARISILAPVPMPAWLGIALGPGYEVGESSSAAAARPTGGLRADYGFVATMDREIMHDPEREVGYGITDSWDEIVETLQGAPVSTDTKQDTDEIYMRLDDEQTERQPLAGRLNMLFRDRHASDLVHGEVMSPHTTVLGQMTEIRELHAADRRRQIVILELLRADHRRSTEIIELRTAL